MGRIVKCAYCGGQFDRDLGQRYKDKNYHKNCYKEVKEKDELTEYICKIFHLKKPGPRNYSLIKRYSTQGLTYTGMLNALKYFYEVQNHSTEKAKESIGIIPYVYEEANKYYNDINNRKEKIKEVVEQKEQEKKVTVKVRLDKKSNRNKTLIDLEGLIGD